MPITTAVDGTTIGYDVTGTGPALVLVDGALCYRGAGPLGPLAAALSDSFTVYTYDRRGRGESSDTLPYAPSREVEDLQAVLRQAGSEAFVYGISSGAALTLAAAAADPTIRAIVLYEPPFLAEMEDPTGSAAYSARLAELLAAGQRGDAVAWFMTNVGLPAPVIAGMRSQPSWAALEAIAPTLAYDDAVLTGGRVPREVAAKITVPTLVLGGGASPDRLQDAARAASRLIPAAEHRTLDGQTHDVAPDALAPVLTGFFLG